MFDYQKIRVWYQPTRDIWDRKGQLHPVHQDAAEDFHRIFKVDWEAELPLREVVSKDHGVEDVLCCLVDTLAHLQGSKENNRPTIGWQVMGLQNFTTHPGFIYHLPVSHRFSIGILLRTWLESWDRFDLHGSDRFVRGSSLNQGLHDLMIIVTIYARS